MDKNTRQDNHLLRLSNKRATVAIVERPSKKDDTLLTITKKGVERQLEI